MLTESQRKAITYLQQTFVPADGYEVKEQKTETVWGGVVFFHYETGLIDDENTMASVFARTRRWFKIGKRGKVESFNGHTSKWENNKFCTW